MLTRLAGEFEIEKSSQMRLFPLIGALSIFLNVEFIASMLRSPWKFRKEEGKKGN